MEANPAELNKLMKTKKATKIIDVREADEYAQGHMREAVNIPLGAFIRDLGKKGSEMLPKDKTIIIHCAAGGRGAIAVSVAEKQGYTNVQNLTGGYKAWCDYQKQQK